jgi:hypothetical protein
MRVNCYAVLSECVERGVARGWSRAHKHTDKPEADQIRQCIEEALLSEICEYFAFDGQ